MRQSVPSCTHAQPCDGHDLGMIERATRKAVMCDRTRAADCRSYGTEKAGWRGPGGSHKSLRSIRRVPSIFGTRIRRPFGHFRSCRVQPGTSAKTDSVDVPAVLGARTCKGVLQSASPHTSGTNVTVGYF